MLITSKLIRTAALLAAIVGTSLTQARAAEDAAAKEAQLIGVLESDAAAADKALACKHLAIYGTAKAVPELAKLLPNEQLSSWTRIALEAIPGPEAGEALTKATSSLEGRLLVGTINSIGVRRHAASVESLTALVQNQDEEVASAAAVALGRIGNDSAVKSLKQALASTTGAVQSAVAEGCVLSAERQLAEGKDAEAIALYDEVRKAEVPMQRILEATRGAILARKDKGIPLLIEQFRSAQKPLFQIALSTAREFPGTAVDKALATEMASAVPERAALIIEAMADRPKTVELPAVLKVAKSGPRPVRLAAIGALGRVGNTSCLSSLLDCATEADPELVETAKKALADLPGESIDKEIVSRLAKPEGKVYLVLIELVGERRIEALSALLKAVDSSDKAVRSAALTSLGQTVSQEKLPVLIKEVVASKQGDDPVAIAALKTACVRMPDRDACSSELASAMQRASTAMKVSILQILGEVGGTKALQTVGAAAKSNDQQLQDESSKLLGKWMTIDVAPVLLDLSKTAPAYQDRAIKGYIRVARQFDMSEPDRIEMCKKAFDACKHSSEQKMVLDVLKRYPNVDNLKLAIKAVQMPELKDDATQTILAIVQKIGGKTPEARELLAGVDLSKVKLEIIKAEYGSGATQKDVTEIVQKQANDLPLITLTSDSYNESFGGDPAPNSPKQLKIQYKINDKAGEASFAENAIILLPMPK